jgi:adenylate cyclase, class 2
VQFIDGGLDVNLSHMEIEYEATFTDIQPDEIRQRLQSSGATLVRPTYLQTRVTLNLPKAQAIPGSWLRVRNEGDKITCSLKIVDGDKIENQKELQIEVSDFNATVELLEMLGAERKAYQETRRELWKLAEVEITIDEWPWLPPFVEIEGLSEIEVKAVAETLGFTWDQAKFCAVTDLYAERYGVSADTINNQTPRIVFGEPNPFTNI